MDDSVNKANQLIASSSKSSLETANLPNCQQNQQQHLKKLYFKQSTTEALHSAILLKARTPLNTCASNLVKTPSFSNYPSIKSDASNPSRQQQLKQISIQENSNVDNARIKLSDEENSTHVDNLLSIDSGSYSTTQLNNSAINCSDELDSPLKIKENIFMSINYLKPVFSGLDPLRSSTSDDEDSHSDNLDRKAKQIEDTSVKDTTQTQTSESSEVIIIGSNNVKFNKKTSLVQTASLQHLSQQYQQRSVYYRKNTHIINPNPKMISSSRIKIPSSNAIQTTLVTTTEPTLIIKNNNLNILNNKAGSKRGKEEALSNSSSSDEDDLNQKQSNFTNNSVNKLNQLFNQNGTVALTPIAKQMTTISSGNKYNNMLTLNMTAGTQPNITPVVSAAANTNQASGTNAIQNVTNYLEPEIINSPSSMSSTSSSFCSSSSSSSSSPSSNQSSLSKSQKSSIDQDYDTKFTSKLIYMKYISGGSKIWDFIIE